jgi:hypothetical protein
MFTPSLGFVLLLEADAKASADSWEQLVVFFHDNLK